MNIQELKNKLNKLNISENWYSINGGLKTDAYILDYVHGKWIFFYFDEKGNREDEKEFDNEDDACTYIFKKLMNEIKYPPNPAR